MTKIIYRSIVNPPKPVITKNVSTEFVVREIVKDVNVIDKAKDLYEIVDKEIDVSKTDLEKLTQSFKGQTGLAAVMQRVAITGDTSLLNTISYDTEQPVLDATKLPQTLGEVQKMAKDIQDIYSKIPTELKAGKTASQFVKDITQADLDAYIQAQVQKAIKDKEGVKDE